MTQGLLLEQQLETYLKHQHVPVHHASAQEDKFKAIDLWVSGLPVQVTLGGWKSSLELARLKAKWDWTKFQSDGRALLVVFDMNTTNKLSMFKHALRAIMKAKQLAFIGIILVDDTGCKLIKG